MKGRVLVCAGSDSGGGAGIQADIKAITAMGAFAMTAVTALTAQNTLGVQGVLGVPPEFIRLQMASCLDDIGADACKTGMLGDVATIEAVCAGLPRGVPVVVDPVMVAKGGARLLEVRAVEALKRTLLPLCTVLTPNIPEAETLSGFAIETEADMRHAAETMLTLGVPAVLLKGGHLRGERLVDLLATPEGIERWEDARLDTRHTHGTGCTLASAVAAGLAQGMALRDAVDRARRYVRAAMLSAPGLGGGHGPLDHTARFEATPAG